VYVALFYDVFAYEASYIKNSSLIHFEYNLPRPEKGGMFLMLDVIEVTIVSFPLQFLHQSLQTAGF
jgi:hypothetical protein